MIVFISYSHDNDEHRQAVIALAVHLRARGVTVIADDQHADLPPPKGWLVWMMDSIASADIVLMVCSARYCGLFEKNDPATGGVGTGAGATWEGAIIGQHLYESHLHNKKFFPILPDGGNPGHIPTILRPWDVGHRFPSGYARIVNLINAIGLIGANPAS